MRPPTEPSPPKHIRRKAGMTPAKSLILALLHRIARVEQSSENTLTVHLE